jgi:hypothetical protein
MPWIIEGYEDLELFWRGTLPKSYTDEQVTEVLRLLLARHMTGEQILEAAKGSDRSRGVFGITTRTEPPVSAPTPCASLRARRDDGLPSNSV